MRWPLRNQIIIPFAGVLLIALVGVSLLNAYLATRRTEQQLVAQLRDVVDTLQGSTFPLTDAVLHQTHGLSGAEFVRAARDGSVLASSLESPVLPAAAAFSGDWDRTTLGATVEISGQRYFHAAVSLRGDQAGAEALHIFYPERTWRDARWQAAYPPLAVGGAALALASALAMAMAARLSRPILQLRAQFLRLAAGNFEPMAVPARNDELRDLIVSANSLAQQLDELRRVIKRSERLALLGQLSGGLAHHLRNDVTGARIAVQLHQRHCHVVDQESLQVALRQLTLCEEHLKRFLTAGDPQPPRRIDCDLQVVIQQTVMLVEPACRHRKVNLEVTYAADSESEDFSALRADPEQLRQLLLNLVLNAIEAVEAGGHVRIESTRRPDGMVYLRVWDDGPGPPPEIEERLFEPFTTGKPEGIGLGLAVARQIAEAHGGHLRLIREHGTCFEVTLPLQPSECEPALVLSGQTP